MDELLSHVTDEKPVTIRQCIQALPELAWEVFPEFEAPDHAPQGAQAFYASGHGPDCLVRRRF